MPEPAPAPVPPAVGRRVRVRPDGHPVLGGKEGVVRFVSPCYDRAGNVVDYCAWVALDDDNDPGWLARTGQRFPLRTPVLLGDLEVIDDGEG